MANNKTQTKGELENVRVVIRVRPLNKKEVQEGHQNIVTVDREDNVISLIKPTLTGEKPKSFKFDHVFPEDCTQVNTINFLYLRLLYHKFVFLDGFISAYSISDCRKSPTRL